MKVKFRIPGKIQGKARARTYYDSHIGGYRSITPNQTASYENLVKLIYDQECQGARWFNKEPLKVLIIANYGITKSTSKKDRKLIEEGKLYPTKKPDADNIAKIICDALNKVAYGDDTQIIELVVWKLYTSNRPYVEVTIGDIDNAKRE